MFSITLGKGFKMTFKNGNTISVQFGYGNYCENRNYSITDYQRTILDDTDSKDAEIAIWDKDGKWITDKFIDCGCDNVIGWIEAEDVADLIFRVKMNW